MACKGVIHEYEIKSLGSGSINRGAAAAELLHREYEHSMAVHAIDYDQKSNTYTVLVDKLQTNGRSPAVSDSLY